MGSSENDHSMDDNIAYNPKYDGNVDPREYQERAIRLGGEFIAYVIGQVICKYLPLIGDKKPHILDIAAGTGILTRELAQLGHEVEATDLSEDMLSYLHEQTPTIPIKVADMNIGRLPYEDENFDGVTTHWANRFIKDLDHFTKEVHRLLRPDGYFFWPVSEDEEEVWAKEMGRKKPVKGKELVSYLQNAGFSEIKIEEISYSWLLDLVDKTECPDYIIVAKK